MIFTTHWFLLFAAAAIALFWAVPRGEIRLWFLAIACAVFHAHFAGPAGVIPIIVLMFITYFAGRSRQPALCVAAMAACVATLCFYKYVLFLIGAAVAPWNLTLAGVLSTKTRGILPGAPPLGISFFVFEFVHYLFDVRRGTEPIRSPVRFVCFAIFFPSLVAGPIKRYEQFVPEVDRASRARPRAEDFGFGLARISLGYFKKVVLADNLTWYIDQTQGHFAELTHGGRWWLVVAIGLRILLDFSGYSDIAIGFGQLLGVRLPENFNWPYFARNLQEFWQRWHISLTSWIRDYVYIPLGGNRLGPVRRFLNALIAFALCGLWHGPAWHFVIWGLWHGVGLAVVHMYPRVPGIGPALGKIFAKENWARWLLTQGFVGLGWLLFFYPVREAMQMMRLLF